jgi:hypothetical protein
MRSSIETVTVKSFAAIFDDVANLLLVPRRSITDFFIAFQSRIIFCGSMVFFWKVEEDNSPATHSTIVFFFQNELKDLSR